MNRIEVFKTNVRKKDQANMLIREIHERFSGYKANFDLEDCDNILRVVYSQGTPLSPLIDLLRSYGFKAEILPDHNTARQTVFRPFRVE